MHRTPTVEDQSMELSQLERQLLNDFQHDFPLSSRPYLDIANRLGVTEADILATFTKLKEQGLVSRVGAVFRANSIGASTLAAMSVPTERLEEVAELINSYSEVNHNYQREHNFNLWFVLTASDEYALNAVMDDIEEKTGIEVMYLPMIEDYHIDLGFDLQWT